MINLAKIIKTEHIEIWGDSVIAVFITDKGMIIKYYKDLVTYHKAYNSGYVEYKHTEEFM